MCMCAKFVLFGRIVPIVARCIVVAVVEEDCAAPGEGGYSCGQLTIASPGEGGGCGVASSAAGEGTAHVSNPDMGSPVVKKVRPRRHGSPTSLLSSQVPGTPRSLLSSQVPSDDSPLPKILHIDFDVDAKKSFAVKRQALRVVQGAFPTFTAGKPCFAGRI